MAHGITRRAAALMLTALLLPSGAAPAAQAPAYDTEWWQEVDLTGMLSDHLAYLVTGVSRLSDADPNPALVGGGAFLSWKQGAFGGTVGYIHAELRNAANGSRLNADLPVVAVAGTLKAGGFAITDQLRIEDLYGVPGNPWRYRNLVALGGTSPRLRPVKEIAVSDEIFVDLNSGQLTRNRLLAGPMFGVSPRSEITVDYVNERDVDKRPGRIQGALVDYTLHF
jgi:hypothetical protein